MNEKILIVDDEKEIADLVEVIFKMKASLFLNFIVHPTRLRVLLKRILVLPF